MSYLEEFELLLANQQFSNFVRLWEEYCLSDQVDGEELKHILIKIKNSPLAIPFGQITETVIPLMQKVKDKIDADKILTLILDLQTTNSAYLADYALEYLRAKYSNHKDFSEMSRLVGLRSRHTFQGAISNFELLAHMKKGSFVFHTGGWGVGEVIETSLLREHAILEFEGITALKDLSFENAFKNLTPLPHDHFLAKRFGDPDTLEKKGKEDPVGLIHLLLRDLGPKTAAEIKDELATLVISEEDWSKWWQSCRAKLKRDTLIRCPKSMREPFSLRAKEYSHEDRFQEALKGAKTSGDLIATTYNFTRDFPEILKNENVKTLLKSLLEEASPDLEETLSDAQKKGNEIELAFLLEDIFPGEYPELSKKKVADLKEIDKVIEGIDVLAYKKRVLISTREHHPHWISIFLSLLFTISGNSLRDYLFKELLCASDAKELLKTKLHELLNRVSLYPEAFVWYFQKILEADDLPYADSASRKQFLEAFMILFHFIETDKEHRDLLKKMHNILTKKRYETVRTIIKDASIEYLQELLLLVSKCHSFSKHDIRIFQSLAEVVAPSLGKKKREKQAKEKEEEIIWTTQEGYQKLQEKMHHIGTVETVENAKEIEAARALGDLRENSEYKFALERRARLQAELKLLTKQFQKARVIQKEDIPRGSIGIGTIVDLLDEKGQHVSYTLLGPWDASVEDHILSFQSKLAQAMIGQKVGNTFSFQNEKFTIKEIRSYL
ncbi:MAG: GreA/GreB family elongation factor [Chlamydiia bacterium]|nr:GreA/GreB family elongation factor [Chlamydiia bacterium]